MCSSSRDKEVNDIRFLRQPGVTNRRGLAREGGALCYPEAVGAGRGDGAQLNSSATDRIAAPSVRVIVSHLNFSNFEDTQLIEKGGVNATPSILGNC
jgi:hypothetical protein